MDPGEMPVVETSICSGISCGERESTWHRLCAWDQ